MGIQLSKYGIIEEIKQKKLSYHLEQILLQ